MAAVDGSAIVDALIEVGYKVSGSDVADALAALAQQCGCSAEEVAEAWEAYAVQRRLTKSPVSAASIEAFRTYLRNNTGRAAAAADGYLFGSRLEMDEDDPAPATFATPAPVKAKAAQPASARGAAGVEPAVVSPPPAAPSVDTLPQLQTPAGGTPFSRRPHKLQATPTLHGHLPTERRPEEAPDVAIEPLQPGLARGARYMAERLEHKVDYLEGRLSGFADALADTRGIVAADPVHCAAPEAISVVGRVLCDSEGRLNEASILIEGSLRHSSGGRAKLELRDLPAFSIFPGQVVAVQGLNPSGYCLVAQRMLSALPPPPAPAAEDAAAGGALSIVVAAGPFTCTGDLAYEPLEELLGYCRGARPHVVVLLGPFVDAEHPVCSSGLLDCSFEDLFALQLRDRIEEYCATEGAGGCQFVLVPSPRDAHHDALFPAPPLADDWETLAGKVVCAPNPALLRVGGVTLALTSQDVLRHMAAAETGRAAAGGDRMARLAAHLVAQRSFYPLHPPALGAAVDTALAAHFAMGAAPDLLVLPSDLAPFAKVVSSAAADAAPAAGFVPPCAAASAEGAEAAPPPPAEAPAPVAEFVALNPGRAAKGALGGSFAHVHIAPATPGGSTAARVRVDMVRV